MSKSIKNVKINQIFDNFQPFRSILTNFQLNSNIFENYRNNFELFRFILIKFNMTM